MEAFVSRKRRKVSPPLQDGSATPISTVTACEGQDDESTDIKLAMLASLHPTLSLQILMDLLLANNGSVEAASTSLFSEPNSVVPQRLSGSSAFQSSLLNFASSPGIETSPKKKKKLLSKKGRTLHLYSPEDIAANTPCSIIHNFLSPDEANDLLRELLKESATFERQTFKLFDNVVSSPHTACFYVHSMDELLQQKTEYIYNGDKLTDVRQTLPEMRKISPKVEKAVNEAIHSRILTHYPSAQKLRYQSPSPWTPNAALVNCYAGGAQNVGYHSDQLTYLGPRPVIGSISLGVAREFRVRRIIPKDSEAGAGAGAGIEAAESSATDKPPSKVPVENEEEDAGDAGGQISIHLPHNSLLIMHAEMQEEWKHCVAPAASIDPHPIAGNRRLNITYRHYKAALHPKLTPRCRCGSPCILRVVQRKKENLGRYFWMCYMGSAPGKNSCTFFEWAKFDDDGNPVWNGKK